MPQWMDELPFVKHIRELREVTGASRSIGWMYDEPAFLLYAIVKWYKPELVIQTGHLWGKSAMIVLAALRDGFLMSPGGMIEEEQKVDRTLYDFIATNRPNAPKNPKVISVDPQPKGVPNSDAGIAYLRRYDPGFEFYPMKSTELFAKHSDRLMREYAGRRMLGIVDGDHTWEGCTRDLEALAVLGTQFIVVDDMTWLPHLKRSAEEFARRNGYEFFSFPFFTGMGVLWKGEGMSISPKSSRHPYSFVEFVYTIGGFGLVDFLRRIKHTIFG